ncbi:hypothetical protein LINPERHAP1_LOCUS24843, partial [Linum perenne]
NPSLQSLPKKKKPAPRSSSSSPFASEEEDLISSILSGTIFSSFHVRCFDRCFALDLFVKIAGSRRWCPSAS